MPLLCALSSRQSNGVAHLNRLGLLEVGRVFDWVWGEGGAAGRVWIIVTDEDELAFTYRISDGHLTCCNLVR